MGTPHPPTPSMAEKSESRTPTTPARTPAPPPTRAQRALLTLFKLCTLLICAVAIRAAYNPEPLLRLPDFFGKHKHKHKHPARWDSGKPIFRSPDATLGWHKCPDNPANLTFYCAFFEAPLNWNEVEEDADEKDWRKWKGGDKVVDTGRIFLRMYPATSEDRLGSMFFNPGGPGGSGNAFLYHLAEEFSNVTEGRYDLIGFDPRGVNMTSPRMKTHDNAYARAVFDVANQAPVQEGDPTNPVNTSIPEQVGKPKRGPADASTTASLHACPRFRPLATRSSPSCATIPLRRSASRSRRRSWCATLLRLSTRLGRKTACSTTGASATARF